MNENIVPEDVISTKIYLIRDQKVMLDRDLAALYQVETKYLKRQVRRNIERFPEDFMFELEKNESEILRSQIGTSSWGGNRYVPMAFTEQGVAQLSSVLNSDRAIQVNIQIIRLFTKMRALILTHEDLLKKMNEVEKRMGDQDNKILNVLKYLKQFVRDQNTPREKIGFKQNIEEPEPNYIRGSGIIAVKQTA